MPIHDWRRVTDGTFHDFHHAWTAEIRTALNSGILPPPYYALAEQIAGPFGPDVLALEMDASAGNGNGDGHTDEPSGAGGLAVATSLTRPRLVAEATSDGYASRRRTIVIRHTTGDRIVALLEIVSPGNKSGRQALRSFVEKAAEALSRGYHLLLVDLFGPSERDPQGIHGAVWGEITDHDFALPSDEPLTLAAYSAGRPIRAYVETTAVGRELIDMPLFMEPDGYVSVPLEATYQAAYRGVPQRWKRVLEASPA